MMLAIELGLGSYTSRKMSVHIRKSKRQRFEMGLHTGDLPFGCTRGATNRDPGTPVPAEASAIAGAFHDRVAGAGFTEIARRWNAIGLRPRSKQGNTLFTASAVQSVLESDFYAGFVRYKGERKRGLHQPIISEELWLTVQAVVRRHPTHAREPWLLAGTICSECGGPIWQSRSGVHNNHFYYREAARQQERPCPVAGISWQRDLADADVHAVICEMTAEPEWLAEIDREARRLPPDDDGGRRAALLEDKRRVNNAFFKQGDRRPRAPATLPRDGRATRSAPDTADEPRLRGRAVDLDRSGLGRHDDGRAPRGTAHRFRRGADEHARAAAVAQAMV